MKCENFDHWLQDLRGNLASMDHNQVLKIMYFPPCETPIHCKWIHKTMLNPNWPINQYAFLKKIQTNNESIHNIFGGV